MKKETKKAEKKSKVVETETLVVDEAYLEAHPDLKDEGVAVGDTIEVPAVPKETAKGLDLDGEVSILKGEEYIRTYPEGNEENVKSFLSKDGKYVAVDPASIVSIQVSWRESIKRQDDSSTRIIDTGKMETKSVIFSEDTHGENWKAEARAKANENGTQRRSCTAKLG